MSYKSSRSSSKTPRQERKRSTPIHLSSKQRPTLYKTKNEDASDSNNEDDRSKTPTTLDPYSPATASSAFHTKSMPLDYFTNNYFSSSFNSLILDDEDENVTITKKRISRSPPFNVKDRGGDAAPDDYSEDGEGDVDDDDDDGDDEYENEVDKAVQLDIVKRYQSPVRPRRLFENGGHANSSSITSTARSTNSTIISDETTIDDTIVEPRSQSASQQSSIKRSSKFLNLSIDNSNKLLETSSSSGGNSASNKGHSGGSITAPTTNYTQKYDDNIYEDIDYISDLNEIDSSILRGNVPTSSPTMPKGANTSITTTPFNSNKFKRPHILISQSPSPSSQGKIVNKSQLFKTTESLSYKSNAETSDIPKLYSPSKLGINFKLLKNADKDAIISPNRMIPQKEHTISHPKNTTTAGGSGIFSHIERPKRVLSGGNRIRKSALNAGSIASIKSPFTTDEPLASHNPLIHAHPRSQHQDQHIPHDQQDLHHHQHMIGVHNERQQANHSSSPISYGFEYYNLENLDRMDLDDSPSKGRKFSNSSTTNSNVHSMSNTPKGPNNIVIYQDNDHDILKTRKKIRNQGDALVNAIQHDDKENFDHISRKSSGGASYKFVKPLQTAFKSTGLVKKNSIGNKADAERKLPPETPIKRHPIMLLGNSSNVSIDHQSIQNIGKDQSHPTLASSLSHVITHDDSSMDATGLDNSIEIGRNTSVNHHDNSISDTSSTFFKVAQNSNSTVSSNKVLNHVLLQNNGDLDLEFSGSEIDFERNASTSSHNDYHHINNNEILNSELLNSTEDEDDDIEVIISEEKHAGKTPKSKELNLDTVHSDNDDIIPETPTKSTGVKKSSSIPANFSPVSFSKSRNMKYKDHKQPKLNPLTISKHKMKGDEPITPIMNIVHISRADKTSGSSANGFGINSGAPKTSTSNATVVASESYHGPELTSSAATSHHYASTLDSINSSSATLCTESMARAGKIDDHLINKFGVKNIKYLGTGEFSVAFECSFQDQKLAIKRSKKQIIGKLEKKAIHREIEALRALTSVKDNDTLNQLEQDAGKEYLVYFIEAWDFNNYYYIMTEYCEGGTLFEFLEENKNYKIDEFRIWKILIEILNGLKFIHSQNYLHLDLKPANIFITFEGSLKIGDFGLATKLPILEKDFDLEGDRNYIAPELINDKIYTPFADIFSVGLIILEIAANIILPDNGTPWRKLRSGDLSDAGKLSSDNISDFLQHQNFSSLSSYNSCGMSSTSSLSHHFHSTNLQQGYPPNTAATSSSGYSANGSGGGSANSSAGRRELKDLIPPWAPDFLVGSVVNNLDSLVSKMLRPNPFDRPTAKMVLETNECVTIENRRKAGATIFEGEFGPSSEDD